MVPGFGNESEEVMLSEAEFSRNSSLVKHGLFIKHNRARSGALRSYESWKSMRQRCRNEKCTDYKFYGGRGITICDRWSEFSNFLQDMGERPKGLTLERKDNDGNYELDNCCWATRAAQVKNKRGNFEKGHRVLSGEDNHLSKLTNAQVAEIRSLYGRQTQKSIAKKFYVSQSNISMICTGLSRRQG